jgi:hypothetical protein
MSTFLCGIDDDGLVTEEREYDVRRFAIFSARSGGGGGGGERAEEAKSEMSE